MGFLSLATPYPHLAPYLRTERANPGPTPVADEGGTDETDPWDHRDGRGRRRNHRSRDFVRSGRINGAVAGHSQPARRRPTHTHDEGGPADDRAGPVGAGDDRKGG